MLFLTSVLCHNRSSDHAELFLAKGGVAKLYKLAALPNFPIDFPTMSSSTTLASIYGAILVRGVCKMFVRLCFVCLVAGRLMGVSVTSRSALF